MSWWQIALIAWAVASPFIGALTGAWIARSSGDAQLRTLNYVWPFARDVIEGQIKERERHENRGPVRSAHSRNGKAAEDLRANPPVSDARQRPGA